MVDDVDISRAANLVLKRHTTDAEIVTARRANELLVSGDLDGCAVWARILRAIIELLRKSAEGERVN